MAFAPTYARSPSRALSLLLLALGTVAACDDPTRRAGPVAIPSVQHGLNRSDSLSRGLLGPSSGQGGSDGATATSDGVAIVSLEPGNFQGFAQPETIVGIVSGRVGGVSVRGSGAIKCAGTYGTIIGYDASGIELGRRDLALIDPADCSTPDNPDDVTFGAQGTLTVTNGIIARFEITPMSPLEFPVFDLTGRASATYSIGLLEAPPALTVTCTPATSIRATATVRCVTTMTDGSAFTPKHLKSTTPDGQVIIEGDISEPSTTRHEWGGPAVASTRVEVTATVAGTDTVATGSFTVTSRIGKLPNWMNEDFPDSGFATALPQRVFTKTVPPLSVAYPGFTFPQDSIWADEGALGVTILAYPNAPGYGAVNSGPNQSAIFVQFVPWGVDTTYVGFATGIYIQQSLSSQDPFYKKQKGPDPYCAQPDMKKAYEESLAHEQKHWVNAHTALAPLNFQAVFDSLVVFPFSEGSDQRATNAWVYMKELWRDGVNASNAQTHATPMFTVDCEVKP